MSKSREMFERAQRILKRLEDKNRNAKEYEDDLYCFFILCYHIKDYLKYEKWFYAIEDFIAEKTQLTICSDLVNGFKHMKLAHTGSLDNSYVFDGGRNHSMYSQDIETFTNTLAEQPILSITGGECRSTSDQRYYITDERGNDALDALSTAKKAISAWYRFFTDHGI